MSAKSLNKARYNVNDEFFTHFEDIEKEVRKYKKQFQNKIVILPCDDAENAFMHFFRFVQIEFQIQKIIAIHYKPDFTQSSYYYELDEFGCESKKPLKSNGDFRNDEIFDLIKTADIVVTNPPFSQFTQFINQLVFQEKKFLVVGSLTIATNKKMLELIKQDKLFFGYNKILRFSTFDKSMNEYFIVRFGNIGWWTNLEVDSKPKLKLTKQNINYQYLDNYDNCIFVEKISEIPKNYHRKMAVPISFLEKYNKEQFNILDCIVPVVQGKRKFRRLIITKRKRFQKKYNFLW